MTSLDKFKILSHSPLVEGEDVIYRYSWKGRMYEILVFDNDKADNFIKLYSSLYKPVLRFVQPIKIEVFSMEEKKWYDYTDDILSFCGPNYDFYGIDYNWNDFIPTWEAELIRVSYNRNKQPYLTYTISKASLFLPS